GLHVIDVGFVAAAELRPDLDFPILMQYAAELYPERARCARQHDALRRDAPACRLLAPALDRAHEVAGHRETNRGQAHRRPIHGRERARRELAEDAALRAATRPPAVVEHRGNAIRDRP